MSMFSKDLNYRGSGGALKLLKCSFSQFIKLNNDLKENPRKTLEIRSRQAFICFSALCCVTEDLFTIDDK